MTTFSFAEWVNLASTVIQAVAIVVTAGFAIAGLRAWRRELVGRRKFEVAEQALSAYAEAKDALAEVRDPLVYREEGTSRPHDPIAGESEQLTRKRNLAFVPLERLQNVHDRFVALSKVRAACRIHFGDEAEEAIDTLFTAHNKREDNSTITPGNG